MKRTPFVISAIVFLTFFFNNSFSQLNTVSTIDAKGIDSFNTILRLPEFKDKVLFIDVWGVHCVPCLEEFVFNAGLREHFKSKPVEYVYLSIDYGHPDDKDRWTVMIKEKNLVGYNLFISMKAYGSIWEPIKNKISKESLYLIPHYLIVDGKSNILFPDAARPSAADTLYRQIQSVLDKSGL